MQLQLSGEQINLDSQNGIMFTQRVGLRTEWDQFFQEEEEEEEEVSVGILFELYGKEMF